MPGVLVGEFTDQSNRGLGVILNGDKIKAINEPQNARCGRGRHPYNGCRVEKHNRRNTAGPSELLTEQKHTRNTNAEPSDSANAVEHEAEGQDPLEQTQPAFLQRPRSVVKDHLPTLKFDKIGDGVGEGIDEREDAEVVQAERARGECRRCKTQYRSGRLATQKDRRIAQDTPKQSLRPVEFGRFVGPIRRWFGCGGHDCFLTSRDIVQMMF